MKSNEKRAAGLVGKFQAETNILDPVTWKYLTSITLAALNDATGEKDRQIMVLNGTAAGLQDLVMKHGRNLDAKATRIAALEAALGPLKDAYDFWITEVGEGEMTNFQVESAGRGGMDDRPTFYGVALMNAAAVLKARGDG